jgi:serine/threonine protein kinase
VTHRDVKPSNLIVNHRGVGRAVVKLADFGSAVDKDTLLSRTLYDAPPSVDETTLEYAPPEVRLATNDSSSDPYAIHNSTAFDSWSIGTVMLELFLGLPNVFTATARDRALLTHQLADKSDAVREGVFFLSALSDYCLFDSVSAGILKKQRRRQTGGCTVKDFNRTLSRRDVHMATGWGWGASNDEEAKMDTLGLSLLKRLLQFDPRKRISANDALQHSFLTGVLHVCDCSLMDDSVTGEAQLLFLFLFLPFDIARSREQFV